MNERDGTGPSDGDRGNARTQMRAPSVQWRDETADSGGWALRWDATALRKVNLARQMRELREASGNP